MLSVLLGVLAIICYALPFIVNNAGKALWLGFALGIAAWIVGKQQHNMAGKVLGVIATIVGIVLFIIIIVLAGMLASVFAGR